MKMCSLTSDFDTSRQELHPKIIKKLVVLIQLRLNTVHFFENMSLLKSNDFITQ
jgi:hypothetical protein